MVRSKGKSATELNNFTIIHNEFIETDLLDSYEKLVFIAIKRHINKDDYTAFPSIKTICRHTQLSKPTVVRSERIAAARINEYKKAFLFGFTSLILFS